MLLGSLVLSGCVAKIRCCKPKVSKTACWVLCRRQGEEEVQSQERA